MSLRELACTPKLAHAYELRNTVRSGRGIAATTWSGSLPPDHHSPYGSELRVLVARAAKVLDTRSVRVASGHVVKSTWKIISKSSAGRMSTIVLPTLGLEMHLNLLPKRAHAS
jgi:hypothetical protein